MPSPPATPVPHAASCFAKEAVRQGRPEPPPPPFQPHPSPRLRQIKGGILQSHQASTAQEIMMGGEHPPLTGVDSPALARMTGRTGCNLAIPIEPEVLEGEGARRFGLPLLVFGGR